MMLIMMMVMMMTMMVNVENGTMMVNVENGDGDEDGAKGKLSPVDPQEESNTG